MSRPNTEGCTEWSCMYHGEDNRFKSAHEEGCPIRSWDGFVLEFFDPTVLLENPDVRCTCEPTESS